MLPQVLGHIKDLLVSSSSMQHSAYHLQERCHPSHMKAPGSQGPGVSLASVSRSNNPPSRAEASQLSTYLALGKAVQSDGSCAAADMLLSLPVMGRFCLPELQSCLCVDLPLKTSVFPISPLSRGGLLCSTEPTQPGLILLTSQWTF